MKLPRLRLWLLALAGIWAAAAARVEAAPAGNQLHVMGGGFQSDGMPRVDVITDTHEVFGLGK